MSRDFRSTYLFYGMYSQNIRAPFEIIFHRTPDNSITINQALVKQSKENPNGRGCNLLAPQAVYCKCFIQFHNKHTFQ